MPVASVSNGAPLNSQWARDITAAVNAQAAGVFTTSTARDSAITSPTAGMVAYLSTPKWVTQWDGSAWIVVGALDGIGCTLTRVTNQSIPNASTTFVSFTTEAADADGFFPGSGATITIPTGLGGTYGWAFTGTLSAVVNARATCIATPSGGLPIRSGFYGDDTPGVTGVTRMSAGHTFSISMLQASGSALNLNPARLEFWRLGP